MADIPQTAFSNAFSWLKMYKFRIRSLFLRSNKQYYSMGSDNGLASVTQQAIIQTDGVFFYWRIYASLSLNEWIDWYSVYHIFFT